MLSRVSYTHPGERGARQRNQAIGFARQISEVPARDGEHSLRSQPLEEETPCFQRVERILRESQSACRGCRPCVDKRNLNDVEPFVRPGDVTPGFVVDETDRRILVEVTSEIPECSINNADDIFIELDGLDRCLAECQGGKGCSLPAPAPTMRTFDCGLR